jgi:hypothetical protein
MGKEITINYKNSRIEFDINKEEWVGFLGADDTWEHEFKRHTSLQKLKDAIDRFNKKEFTPIPILSFGNYGYGNIVNYEIISFTSVEEECWIRRLSDDRREKISTKNTKIYACENIQNEPILIEILGKDVEISLLEKELEQRKKEKIHLVDSLEKFDIRGRANDCE